jgi:hypothetical protein
MTGHRIPTVLQPVEEPGDPARAVSLYNSPEGRAFGSQEPHEEHPRNAGRTRLHLPVTARGERMGILTVLLPPEPVDPAVTDELVQVADLLGQRSSWPNGTPTSTGRRGGSAG